YTRNGGQNSGTARTKNSTLYQNVNGTKRKGRRSSLPVSSTSECSSSNSSRTSKYLQQCTCCIGPDATVNHSMLDTSRPSTSKQQRRFSASQFTVPKMAHSSTSCSTITLPPHKSCFCPACIAKHNMAVAKL